MRGTRPILGAGAKLARYSRDARTLRIAHRKAQRVTIEQADAALRADDPAAPELLDDQL
jgi:hypothetical protein